MKTHEAGRATSRHIDPRPRQSGVMVPLFSVTSTRGWGVGEFPDLATFAGWLTGAGQAFIQILPLSEIPEAETSPYSALTAMALDPIYISLPAMEDFQALGGESRLGVEDRSRLERARNSPRIEHTLVRALKERWMRRAYEHFVATDLDAGSPRAQRFEQFVRVEAWWLDDYALFQSLRRQHLSRPWWQWTAEYAERDERSLAAARTMHRAEIGYRQYVQWVASEQIAAARARARPLRVFGDVPFMISADSPDVWTRQREFRFDGTVGVPPDAFSETGQDWGLPPWRWEVMANNDFEWMRQRARRTASLFDGFRLDHLVGLYRTYIRPLDPGVEPFFVPDDEATQLTLGERLVRIYLETGAEVVAEDLGTVPDFVRASLQRLGVPGFKVFRWERQWALAGRPFTDPPQYPPLSVATTGTHDTEPLAPWWDSLSKDERIQVLAIPALRDRLAAANAASLGHGSSDLTQRLNDAILQTLLHSGSRLVILPFQDVFGWHDRINTPASVGATNWTWRVPWRIDRLDEVPEARERGRQLAEWSRSAGR